MHTPHRQGNFLVVVLGLISLFLALIIGLTLRVQEGKSRAASIAETTAQHLENSPHP